MAAEGEILEGFFCPICKADLHSALQLHAHFQEEHNEEPDDVLKSLKGFLGKAKKKILRIDEELFSSDLDSSSKSNTLGRFNRRTVNYAAVDCEPQDIGACRGYYAYFNAVRKSRVERYAAETNKLLIRLDKLLHDLPTDTMRRKAHEQAIVPWIDDKDVKLCPSCAKTFHLARRKHHCRLCGAIMCHDCTHFLQLVAARKMTNPAFGHDVSTPGTTLAVPPTTASGVSPRSTVNSILRRSGSNTSLNSVLSLVDSVTGEQHFRLCVHCNQMLDARERLKEERGSKPILSQFYERLRTYESEADQLALMYLKMCQSLSVGESTYNLTDAQMLRVKILKLAESIDSLSKKISVLGTKDVDPPKGSALQLQQKIRVAATCYLRDQLVVLPNLPTEEQLAEMAERRRQEVSARILQEKQAALAAQQRASLSARSQRDSPQRRSPSRQPQPDQVTADTGWGPESSQMFDTGDPMIQQMNIIRNYIKQARSAHKYDEVSTLEANLKELQTEYYRQQETSE